MLMTSPAFMSPELPDVNEPDDELITPKHTDAATLITADSQVSGDGDDADAYQRLVPLALNNR